MTPDALRDLLVERLRDAEDATTTFMETVAEGPLGDPGFVLAAIQLAFELGMADAMPIANTLEILLNPPEPDWTGGDEF